MKTIVIPRMSARRCIKLFLQFLNPILKLTNRELDTLATILYYRHLYITEEGMRDGKPLYELLFGHRMRAKMREELAMSYASFGNVLSSLKAKNIIIEQGGTLYLAKGVIINPGITTGIKVQFQGVSDESETN